MGTRAPFPKRAIGGLSPDINPQTPGKISNRERKTLETPLNHSKQTAALGSNREYSRAYSLHLSRSLAASRGLKTLTSPLCLPIEWSVLNTVCVRVP
jgi:hypothetical protein